MIPTIVGIIPTLQEDVLPSVGIFLTKFNSVGIFPNKILAKSSIKHYTCRNHASYTSVKFLPALYFKIMISYLVWNMFSALQFIYYMIVRLLLDMYSIADWMMSWS